MDMIVGCIVCYNDFVYQWKIKGRVCFLSKVNVWKLLMGVYVELCVIPNVKKCQQIKTETE